MQHNKSLQISVGVSRKAVSWTRCNTSWIEFVERLKTPMRGSETMESYLAMPKSKQDELKDVGGFVGGTLVGERRKAANVQGRDLITLDLDNIPTGQTQDVLKRVSGLGCAAVVYSTRKHTDFAPRLRVIIPIDRTASADEYEPSARKIAALIGIEFCDPTTFEASRLMYWPSCCADSNYVCEVFDNPFCSLDGLLGLYQGDWRNVTIWPQVPGSDVIEKRRLAKQEDPTTKRGIIGAFCRTYSITQAMDKFLPGIYEETTMSGRYTYVGGSTMGGAVIYDGDLFLYSHHATDPCSGLLVNAFDLVRLHKFGELDNDSKPETPVNKLPSFKEMNQLALADSSVSSLINQERYDNAQQAFASVPEQSEEQKTVDTEWMKKLAFDGNGNVAKTINNAVIVLNNDPNLKGLIVIDEFSCCSMVLGQLPWSSEQEKRRWCESDDAGYYNYMELTYGIAGRDKLDSALLLVSSMNKVNFVRDYLKNLKWDGVKRVDTLLMDYLGADDTAYVRAVMRKSLCAAVARAIIGGVKYDYMPIFVGPQGIGKSTFLAKLGKDWFSDSLTSFEGKEAAELIQGTWINEIGELTAMNKQETNAVKQFLSKNHDIYRAAYGRRTEKYPRRCVFFGTSNDTEFLKDATGNRRFWPVDVGEHKSKKSIYNDLDSEVDQIWAEAYIYWSLGEPLYMPKELEEMARIQQENHRESSGKEGIILDFLNKQIPSNWDSMNLMQRKQFWSGNLVLPENIELVDREKVCAMEVWVECFNGDIKYMTKRDSIELVNILRGLKGWKRNKDSRRYGPYGRQKGFERA